MTSSKSIGACPADATLTIRAGSERSSSGKSNLVSRKGAR
jgi:hypothetical protein